ncbi:Co2+/Mg2+ efflux protein ApaG [uncultured Vibrio sp.]|uniref:Co2+/Mg2+ efflux protein ApaG n=1 Tax=uncultured Vibrio sp. TaxID=114054 RepID=UPI0009179402|nr:Co2+/Mg2+ efflux protein ApaG [uncultured Vibrio sp.]OIQ24201.1 MAG: Co2+/Mg2+ efflux protein ApaG [Vibrio sp. MedPE-SWchi]
MIEPIPNIQIHVQTKYVEEQSTPDENHYIFAYLITIKNLSDNTVQLLRRRWLITDANGKQMSIEGEGVVGQQPHIESNKEYSYTSATAVETPIGVMQGQYIFHDNSGNEFTTEITPFRLAIPNILN